MNIHHLVVRTKSFLLEILCVLLFLTYSAQSFAADVRLSWAPNSEYDLAGYKLYFRPISGSYGTAIDVGNQTNGVVTGLGTGTFFFVVTAYNTAGLESAFSNEVSTTIPGPPPTFDFLLSNEGPQSVTAGSSVSNTITATLVSGTAQAVDFSSSGLPSGASATFSVSSCKPTCSTRLDIGTAATTPTGTYTITVTAAGNVSRSTTFNLTVIGTVTDSGLLAHWKFDDGSGATARDSSGNGIDGTLVNGASWTGGVLGGALRLDGVNDYMSYNLIPLYGSFTIAAWAYDEAGAGMRTLVGNYHFWTVLSYDDAPNVRFGSTGYNYIQWDARPTANAWHHVAVVRRSTDNRAELFIDGISQGSRSIGGDWTTWYNALRFIGRSHRDEEGLFRGRIDDVRVYNRALGALEIGTLYGGAFGSPLTTSPTLSDLTSVESSPRTSPAVDTTPPALAVPSESKRGGTESNSTGSSLIFPRAVSKHNPVTGLDNDGYTGVAIANLDDSKAALSVIPFDQSKGKKDVTNPVSVLSPGQQVSMINREMFGSASPAQPEQDVEGWIRIQSTSDRTVGSFFTFNSSLSVLDGADASFSPLTSSVLLEIEDQGFTQIHVSNPKNSRASVRIDLVKADGALRGSVTRIVDANATLSESFTELFPQFLPVGSDYLRLTSRGGIVPFEFLGKASRYIESLNGRDATTGSTRLYSPQYAIGSAWRSTLSVVNLDAQSGSVAFRLIGDDGTQIGPTKSVPIAAHGKIHLKEQSFFENRGAVTTQGYVEVISSGVRLAGSVVFGDPDRNIFSTALPLISSLQRSVIFGHVASDETFFTGIAIANPNQTTVHATLELYRQDGTLEFSVVENIPPRQRKSKLLTEYFPNLKGQNRSSGYIKVTTDVGVASFALFGTKNLSALASLPAKGLRP